MPTIGPAENKLILEAFISAPLVTFARRSILPGWYGVVLGRCPSEGFAGRFRHYLPGDREPIAEVSIPFANTRHLVAETPTSAQPLRTRVVSPTEGMLKLDLSPTPVFLAPIGR